jgi:hypothetical protein
MWATNNPHFDKQIGVNMNESAFPWSVDDGKKIVGNKGMTMRDYFAAKAMMALIAHPDSDGDKPPSVFAKTAYVMADAMLKARGE